MEKGLEDVLATLVLGPILATGFGIIMAGWVGAFFGVAFGLNALVYPLEKPKMEQRIKDGTFPKRNYELAMAIADKHNDPIHLRRGDQMRRYIAKYNEEHPKQLEDLKEKINYNRPYTLKEHWDVTLNGGR